MVPELVFLETINGLKYKKLEKDVLKKLIKIFGIFNLKYFIWMNF